MFNFDVATFSWTEALIVFICTGVADLLWTVYIRRTTDGKAVPAATYSALIILLGAIVVTTYVENSFYLAPAVTGAFLGTLLTIRLDKKKAAVPEKVALQE